MKKKFLFLLIIVFIGLLVFGLVTQFKQETQNKNLSIEKKSSTNKSNINGKDDELEVKENESYETSKNSEQDSDNYFYENNSDGDKSDSSSLVVSYVEDTVDTAIKEEEISSKNESKLKNTFILLTDFIFYNGRIKGYTFSELRNEEKEKIVNSWEKLDNYIEKKYPNYKQKIKDTSSKNYSKIKEKLSELKENINNTFREKVGEETYSNTVNQFNEDKENFNNTIDPYKNVGKSAIEKAKEKAIKAKEKIKDWYQNYKESNR
ncbi:MAG: hypothetical protein IK997_03845 [Bacilli bacterium]|nr:hypothetical protein [Bacilli bacterium]